MEYKLSRSLTSTLVLASLSLPCDSGDREDAKIPQSDLGDLQCFQQIYELKSCTGTDQQLHEGVR